MQPPHPGFRYIDPAIAQNWPQQQTGPTTVPNAYNFNNRTSKNDFDTHIEVSYRS